MKAKGKKDGNQRKRETFGRAMGEARKIRREKDKKILAMDYDEFKKAVIEKVNGFENLTVKMLMLNLNQHNNITSGLTGVIKDYVVRDLKIASRNFDIVKKRLDALEEFTLFMAIKFKDALQRHPMTFKERKHLASYVSIKWGRDNEKAYNAFQH